MPTSTAHRNRGAAPSQPTAKPPIDDTRIREIMELAPPAHLLREFPASDSAASTTYEARLAIHRVLHGADDRLLVVVGPCGFGENDAAARASQIDWPVPAVAVDGDGYYSRPGPRLADGVAQLGAVALLPQGHQAGEGRRR